MTSQVHAHKLVAETARSMAHDVYDSLMRNDELFKEWKNLNPDATPKALETRFVNKIAAQLLPQARATLAGMLAQPYDEVTKAQIHEALILDATLMKGRDRARSL